MAYLNPEVELRSRMPLLGGLARPPGSLSVVLRHALAVVVHEPEVELRIRIPLLGGLAGPLHRLFGLCFRCCFPQVVWADHHSFGQQVWRMQLQFLHDIPATRS